MELSLSAFAWMGYVMFQAMLHYTLRSRKRLDSDGDEPALEASPLVLELALSDAEDIPLTDNVGSYSRFAVDEEYCTFRAEDADDTTLDGDEPPVFFELLSQTGCEMMRNVSIECIVLEQIHEEERAFASVKDSPERHMLKMP